MTQTISTNYDTLNNLMLTSEHKVSENVGFASQTGIDNSVVGSKFNSILDKTLHKKETTLGDIKDNIDLAEDVAEITDNFREILLQASQEVNLENSLDLTLARDINEIIGQLQAAVSVAVNADSEAVSEIAESVNTAIANTTESLKTLAEEIEIPSDFNSGLEENIKITKAADTKTDEQTSDIEPELDADMLEELNIESISSETDYSGGETDSQQESASELGVKVMLNQSTEKFDSSLMKTLNTANQSKPVDVTPEKIIEQITKHLDSIKSTSKINIVLNPEALGKVNLQIINSKDGLSAQFTVTTNEARELLMKGLDGLKENLLTQGVSVDNVSVKVSESEEAYDADWTDKQDSEGGNKGQSRQNREEKEKGLFEKTISESLKNKDGNV